MIPPIVHVRDAKSGDWCWINLDHVVGMKRVHPKRGDPYTEVTLVTHAPVRLFETPAEMLAASAAPVQAAAKAQRELREAAAAVLGKQ